MTDPVPYYPEMRCHLAPLRPGQAPLPDCPCRVCSWARARFVQDWIETDGPILPGSVEWEALLTLAGAEQ